MSEDKPRPIFVIKRKVNAAGHHGGAWKVAYADFVTAMMAFFMVMWLVASVSKEQRAAMFEYFHNPSMEAGHSVKAAPGQSGPGGASTSLIKLGGGLDAPKMVIEKRKAPDKIIEPHTLAEAKEREQLESLLAELRKAVSSGQALEPYKDQLLIDISTEGLRIQILDKLNRPMFDSGSAALKDYTTQILVEVANYLNTVPNRISISGHTDAKPYPGNSKLYSNWELSADRANAARRALISGGLDERKIARTVGLASSSLFVKNEPLNPINRRISIIVMTQRAEDAALSTDAPMPDATASGGGTSSPASRSVEEATTKGATALSVVPSGPSANLSQHEQPAPENPPRT